MINKKSDNKKEECSHIFEVLGISQEEYEEVVHYDEPVRTKIAFYKTIFCKKCGDSKKLRI